METVTRTIFGANLQTSLLFGKPYEIAKFTTLNESLGISANVAISSTDVPKLGYLAIGSGGHKFVVGANQIGKPDPIQHSPTDAALYKQIPFVLRPIGNDLGIIDQQKYALKKRISVGNGADLTEYFAYYLKKVDLTNTVTKMELKSIVNGVTTTTDYVPTASNNLTMSPPVLSNSGVNVTSGDYITVSAKIEFILTPAEVTEIINASTILYGDPGFAIISEIALCSGVSKNILFEGAGFEEIIGCQVIAFMNTFFALNFANAGVNALLNIGSAEYLGLTA